MRKFTLLAAAAFAATAVPASAAIQLFDVPGAVQPDQNVLLPTGQSATTVFGSTNQTGTSVTFQSLTCTTPGNCTTFGDTLTTPANGQARIESTDGSIDALQFFLTLGGSFTQFEFNLFNAVTTTQTLTLFGISNGGTPFSQVFNLDGNGQNFFAGNATGGDVFTRIAFDASGQGGADVRQVRIGGLAGPNGNPLPLPEPGTWGMMILGFGVAGIAIRRSRRRKALLTQIA